MNMHKSTAALMVIPLQGGSKPVYLSVLEEYEILLNEGGVPHSKLRTLGYVLKITDDAGTLVTIPIDSGDALEIAQGALRSAVLIIEHEKGRRA